MQARPFRRPLSDLTRYDQVRTAPKLKPSLACTACVYLERLSRHHLKLLAENADYLHNKTLRLGTTCSGLDIASIVLEQTIKEINARFGVSIRVQHIFSCESDPKRLKWIKNAFGHKLSYLFDNVEVFGRGQARCLLSDQMVPLPEVDILVCGPSCKSLSKENIHCREYASCYEDGTGCSGITYKLGFLKACEVQDSFQSIILGRCTNQTYICIN